MTDAKEKKFFDEYIGIQRKKMELLLKEKELKKKIQEHKDKKKK